MRILLINNFFRDVGGVERVFFAERDLLRLHGHEVIDFSTEHPANHQSSYAKFFVSPVDFHAGGNLIKKAMRFFYSREVAKKLDALIDETRPDVVHIQGIFDVLGPTVLYVLKKRGVPVVFTAHAYKLVCPSGKFFSQGTIDESCQRNLLNDALHRSVQNSYLKSLWAVAALWFHTWRGMFDSIARIISPSMFLIHKHGECGFDSARFVHIPNPVDVMKFSMSEHEGEYILFVGRLVEEKGIDVLLEAAARLPEINFKIVGDGPLRKKLERFAREKNLLNISFEGARSPHDVQTYVAGARAVVVPSVCYENDPYSVLEAQAQGKVVIAAYTGGISEQIRHGETGFLFERGNANALAEMVREVWAMSPRERTAIGKRARAFVDTIRNPEMYYEALVDVLGSVIDASKRQK